MTFDQIPSHLRTRRKLAYMADGWAKCNPPKPDATYDEHLQRYKAMQEWFGYLAAFLEAEQGAIDRFFCDEHGHELHCGPMEP